jgi:subtilisin-like proprotein convertase family protein
MDAQSTLRWIFSFFFMLVVFSPAVFAGPTFRYGGEFNLPILDKQGSDGSITEAFIPVPDHLTVYDLDVAIDVKHTNVFDLQIFIQSPVEARICLNMYDVEKDFFKGADYVQTIFDDEAEIPIEQAIAPFTGRFRPKAGNLLSIFDGQDAYGIWRLQIYDMWYWDTGNLERFELIITVCEPTSLTLLALGTCLTILFRRRQV